MIRELDILAEEGLLSPDVSTFLDLGTGNGHMLFALRYPEDNDDEDESTTAWSGEMVGVDYSAASIDLARRIASQRHDREDSSTEQAHLRFETWDLLTQPPGPWLSPSPCTFDVVLDKGTFDAVSLMHNTDESPRHPCDIYREKAIPLVKEGGFLVITSCNWTRDELVGWLVGEQEKGGQGLELFREATYPSFTFGGKKGQSVVTLIFRRRAVVAQV